MKLQLEPSWHDLLEKELDKPYFKSLMQEVTTSYQLQSICPKSENIFRAFDLVPPNQLRVVILGQDPYHTPEVADGLAFSSTSNHQVPPSLKNIYKEIIQEFNLPTYPYKNNPDLTRWAKQGVLLLNTSLTVVEGQANSHSKIGWDKFTDKVIELLAAHQTNLVFMLWGSNARQKSRLITTYGHNNHLVLESAHPSPLSAYKGFFGNGHFVKCNQYLQGCGYLPVAW